MKNMSRALRGSVLSCALVLSLLFGISASPAFAAYGDASTTDGAADAQPSGGQDGQGGQPDDVVISGDDEGDDDGADKDGGDTDGDQDGDGNQDTDGDDESDKPFDLFGTIANLPEAIGDEITSMVENATDSEGDTNPVRKSYDKIWYSGQKTWKDAEGNNTNEPLDKDGNPIESVTIRIQGFVDWDGDGTVGAADKEKTRSEYTKNGVLGEPKYAHTDSGRINSDLNGDGTVDHKDKWFDNERSGCPSTSDDLAIVPPYQVYDKSVSLSYNGTWEYSTDNMEAYFYEYEPVVDEDGTDVGTLTFVLDEQNKPVRHEILYSVTELPVDGYTSTRNPGGDEFSANVHPDDDYTGYGDGGTENMVVDFVNTPKTVHDRTGQIVINKTFSGPIYATGSQGDYNTGNTATVVFHIVGEMRNDNAAAGSGTVVFDGYRAMNFYGDGDREQTLVVDGLPVGAWYTVTEVVFDGQGYVQAGDAPAPFKLEATPGVSDEGVKGDTEGTEHVDGTEGDGATDDEAADDAEGGNDADEKPAASATYTVSFSNVSTGEETPNQGWINRYTVTDGGYTVTQIQRVERLQ